MKSKILDSAFLSKDCTSCLKGLLCLLILWHHIAQKSMRFYATDLGSLFQMLGYLSVALFFFISGYGLMKNAGAGTICYKYINTFPRKRILTFYADVTIFALLYAAASALLYGRVEWLTLLKTLTYGATIIANGWYFQTALVLYLLFWLSFLAAKKPSAAFWVCTASVFAFCVLNMALNASATVYESVLAFPLGMAFAFYPSLAFLYRKAICAIPAALVFAAGVLGEYRFRGTPVGIGCKMLSAVAFVLLCLICVRLLCQTRAHGLLINPVFAWLGARSFEIYALQGLFLNIFKDVDAVYRSLPLYAAVVTALTLASSALIHIPMMRLNKWIGGGKKTPQT